MNLKLGVPYMACTDVLEKSSLLVFELPPWPTDRELIEKSIIEHQKQGSE